MEFGDSLQLLVFIRYCDTILPYHKNYTLSLSWNSLPYTQPESTLVHYIYQQKERANPIDRLKGRHTHNSVVRTFLHIERNNEVLLNLQ